MGQYYTAVIADENGNNKKAFYTYGLKLMEHSWWFNPPMNYISSLLYKKPSILCWIGDYADEDSDWEDEKQKNDWYGFAWGDNNKSKELDENSKGILLDGKYLVNHTQKIYVDCSEYFKQNSTDRWCVYPISLLTAKGNGRGGGDYHDSYPDFDEVGSWALDVISVEDEIPTGYESVMYNFKED